MTHRRMTSPLSCGPLTHKIGINPRVVLRIRYESSWPGPSSVLNEDGGNNNDDDIHNHGIMNVTLISLYNLENQVEGLLIRI